ncbi:MAG: NYN domain-containing protein [Gemmatimonadaceae bacterium]|nr:NYN domain-containing protein [Gemmatimonadaceae bacterium]
MSGSPIHHHPNAALLIDFDNVTMGIRSDLQTELRNLLSSAIVKGKVAVQRAYADWRRYPQYIVPMYESSIDLIYAPAYGSAKKNATDIRLAIDALELVFTRPEIGTFILLSGDSDFSSLVIKLKEYGKYVIGVGIRESSSDLLVQNCDEYYSYNALAGLVKFGDEENIKRDPWELVGEAIERMQRNGDVMRADRLKQVMQQMDNSFDEKDLGMAKFSRFVSEAAHKGLLTLTKLENGQFEVGPVKKNGEAPIAHSDAVAVSPLAAPEKKEGDRPSRGRRGGRGGRGGRTREVAAARVAEPVAEAAPVVEQESTEIGSSGTRLTRDDAFSLVRRSVESLVNDGDKPRATAVRAAARQILGRDSESLSEKNFIRILQDAHAGDIIDLRKRGNDYEVDLASSAAPVTEQLAKSAPVVKTPGPTATPSRAGSVPRGRGAIGGKRGEIPADLFSVGVVPNWGDSEPKVVDEPAAAASETAEASEEPVKAKRPSRPRRPRKAASQGDESSAPKRARKPKASAVEKE